jgi:hypothetical protein
MSFFSLTLKDDCSIDGISHNTQEQQQQEYPSITLYESLMRNVCTASTVRAAVERTPSDVNTILNVASFFK